MKHKRLRLRAQATRSVRDMGLLREVPGRLPTRGVVGVEFFQVRGPAGAARALPAGAHNADSATRCTHPSCDPVHVVQEDASNNATRRIAVGLTLETDPALLSREMYRAITDGNVTKVPCPCVNKLFFIFPKRRRSPTTQTRICRSDSG